MAGWQFGIIIVLLILTVTLLVVIFLRMLTGRDLDTERLQDELVGVRSQLDAAMKINTELNARLREEVSGSMREVREDVRDDLREMSDEISDGLAGVRSEVNVSLREGMRSQSDQLLRAASLQNETLSGMKDSMVRTLTESVDRLQASNAEHLDRIRGVVDEKLDKTLNDRLDMNFRAVGDQLGRLYQSLGELQALSGGVNELNRTLANVKTRGIWGEVQLGRILEQTMTRSQYDVNVAVRKNSDDRVEFAVRFPAQDGSGDMVYLPIDAKFPSDIYNRIAEAAEAGDSRLLQSATGELKGRILEEARSIRNKYINPPITTGYAVMFLPTEGLYAEVLRIDGLTEKCQSMGVIVAGPTTITALLNSLQVGFRNVQLSKKSVEVMKLLEAVKAQFARLDEEIGKTRKKLTEAQTQTEKLQNRARIIRNRMRRVGEIDVREADRLLLGEEKAEEVENLPFPELSAETESLPFPEESAETESLPFPEVSAETESLPFPEESVEAESLPFPDVSAETENLLFPEMSAETE